MYMRCKTVVSAALLILLIPYALTAQNVIRIFGQETVPEENDTRSAVLSEAEHRSRLARLDGDVDLNGTLVLNLFDDVTFHIELEKSHGHYLPGIEVWHGRVHDDRFSHIPHYRNTVFVFNRKSGRIVANIEAEQGFFQLLPTFQESIYRIRHCKTFENHLCRNHSDQDALPGNSLSGTRAGCGSECDETDEDGRHVLDLFAGYSEEAAAVAVDLDAHATANAETVNMGFANSLVNSVFMRVIGTGVVPNNPGIIPDVLADAWQWFASDIEELAPDFVAVFQTPTDAPNSAGGWGYMPGRSSVNGVAWPTVFRHEFGHNVGGAHCYPDNESHFNGFDNGNWRTHLCGNDVNFYSTPLLNDNLGNPIGDAVQADMVRAITETASEMATYAMHRVPYFEGDECTNMICLPGHWGDPIEHIERVQFNTIDNQQVNSGWNCASVTGYSDYTTLSTDVLQGATYTIVVTPDFSWAESTLDVWVDWNGNGLFSEQENVVALTGNGPWSADITVPEDAVTESVRMRLRLLYGLEQETGPCDESWYSSGETEDYTLNISESLATGTNVLTSKFLTVMPNPTSGMVIVKPNEMLTGKVEVRLLNTLGQQVMHSSYIAGPDSPLGLDLSDLPSGVYLCRLTPQTGGTRSVRILKE